jgi:hypothetical protein
MDIYHLNQFNNQISNHYDSIVIPTLQSLKDRFYQGVLSLFELNNTMFYGQDISLCKTHMYELLRWGLNVDHFRLSHHTISVNNVDVSYSGCDFFVQFNFDTHLNKEKNSLIDFIKQLSSQTNVIQDKHIFVLWNIETLTHQSQYRLRRVIEKNQNTTLFIGFVSQCSKLIEPLQSRFMMLRVPCLSTIQKKNLFVSLSKIKGDENKDDIDSLVMKKVETDCVTLEDIFIAHQIYSINKDSFSKDIKAFKIVENEINLLFKSFSKIKNVHSLIDKTRVFIYKLIHYNLDHSLIIKTIVKIVIKLKITDDKLHKIISLVAKFDHDILFINVCKIIHAYEYLFIELYKIIYNESG